jgi:hypothetical protein
LLLLLHCLLQLLLPSLSGAVRIPLLLLTQCRMLPHLPPRLPLHPPHLQRALQM